MKKKLFLLNFFFFDRFDQNFCQKPIFGSKNRFFTTFFRCWKKVVKKVVFDEKFFKKRFFGHKNLFLTKKKYFLL